MLWTPWQLAQLATSSEPAREARPWKLSLKVEKRSESMPYFWVSRSESWQEAQISTETFFAAAGERASPTR